jgi:hypothetical protein
MTAHRRQPLPPAAIGLRVKSGRAIAIVLRGPAESPAVIRREELLLTKPGKPKPWQPFHAVMNLPWKEALAATREPAREAGAAAARGLREIQKQVRDAGLDLQCAGIVDTGTQDPAHIGSPHIRAHAAEGQFFRQATERGADACGLDRRTFAQKTIYETAAPEIGCSVAALKSRVAALGVSGIKPWRAEEKEAALAAWIVLAARRAGK